LTESFRKSAGNIAWPVVGRTKREAGGTERRTDGQPEGLRERHNASDGVSESRSVTAVEKAVGGETEPVEEVRVGV
jgi:hypothetical protein